MYIIEKIIQIISKCVEKKNQPPVIHSQTVKQEEDVISCKHYFMPVDSTGEILACSKCGYMIKKKRLKN